MKQRYLSLLVILTFILVMSVGTGIASAQNPQGDDVTSTTEGSPVSPTEEPTAAPTEEPTVEPIVAPTEEPTVEPTVEPTTEPTAVPTEEPTAEPTAVPTEEPTAEPTAVPTEEPTVIPTEEPTVEPTVTITPTKTMVEIPVIDSFIATPSTLTDTSVLTTTLTWTVAGADTLALNGEDVTGLTEKLVGVTETTTYTLKATNAGGSVEAVVVVEVTPAMDAAGEIEAAAIPGSFTTQYLMVQNISSAATDVSVGLHTTSSTANYNLGTTSVPVNGNALVSLSSINDGEYSGVVQSSNPVVAAVYNVNSIGKLGDMYLGSNTPKQDLILPLIYRNHYQQSSVFYIQNTHSAAQDITVETYLVNTTSAAASHTYTSVPQNTSVKVDFANDSLYNSFCSGNGCYGYAVIHGGSGNVAVVSQQIRDLGDNRFMTSYSGLDSSGLSDSDAGKDIVAPLVYSNWYGWISGINVVNTENTPATVTMNYYSNKGNGSQTQTIAPKAVALFYLPNITPGTSYGSGRFTSDKNIVVMVNNANSTNGWASATAGLNAAKATKKVALPLVLNSSNGSAWRTGINVYSFGTSTITTTFITAGSDPTNSANVIQRVTPASANSVTLLFGPDFLPTSSYVGAAYIESSDSNIMVLTNAPNLQQGYSGQMPGFNY